MVTKRLTDTAGKAAGTATKAVRKATDKATDTVGDLAPADLLTNSVRELTNTVTTRAVTSLTDKLTAATVRLVDYSAGNGTSLLAAATGLEKGAVGKLATGVVKAGLSGAGQGISGGVRGVADKAKQAVGGGKGDKVKVTNIVEQVDIGLDLELTYDLFTQFTDFPRFMKKVEHVEQLSDEKLEWTAQIFWSHRTWEATILEQVPYERIIWRSKGAKGHVDGAVTFHELAPNLTRVMVVLEYHPKGLFEHTGNLWRAQGRRARLELKNFRRHAMAHGNLHPDEISGWHGEIHDGKVAESGADDTDTDEDNENENDDNESDEDENGGKRR